MVFLPSESIAGSDRHVDKMIASFDASISDLLISVKPLARKVSIMDSSKVLLGKEGEDMLPRIRSTAILGKSLGVKACPKPNIICEKPLLLKDGVLDLLSTNS